MNVDVPKSYELYTQLMDLIGSRTWTPTQLIKFAVMSVEEPVKKIADNSTREAFRHVYNFIVSPYGKRRQTTQDLQDARSTLRLLELISDDDVTRRSAAVFNAVIRLRLSIDMWDESCTDASHYPDVETIQRATKLYLAGVTTSALIVMHHVSLLVQANDVFHVTDRLSEYLHHGK
jgi:hypothetical protein